MNRGIKVLQTSALPLGYGAELEQFEENAELFSAAFMQRYLLKTKDANCVFCSVGAEDEIRTRDVHLGKVTLYH